MTESKTSPKNNTSINFTKQNQFMKKRNSSTDNQILDDTNNQQSFQGEMLIKNNETVLGNDEDQCLSNSNLRFKQLNQSAGKMTSPTKVPNSGINSFKNDLLLNRTSKGA